jgi:DNA-binding protein HU-beta
MAKGKKITKTQLATELSEATGTSKKTASLFLETLASIAYREAKKGEFTVPGIGKLVKSHRKARTGRNPATGEPIKIPAKTVVKFRVAKAAKDSVLGGGKK